LERRVVKLIVCPMIHTRQNFEAHRPSHVLGLLSPGQDEIALPHPPKYRLELRFNDIAAQQDGLVAPDEKNLRAILAFAQSWDATAPMLIYCFAGISRSTAAAFAITCQRHPHMAEQGIATLLRRASPWATPNALMIALADVLLDRQGRMKEAASAIGRGDGLFEGQSFELAFEAFT
jgi:predicted protein tyrosine phosphatase